MIKIVITGAESTGKSLLAEQLVAHYHGKGIPELARSYVENLNRKYTYSDIESIAQLQIEMEAQLKGSNQLIFFDTWLIITKVWFDFVYGTHPVWLHEAIVQSDIDLFLLCDTDLAWIDDPVRENGGSNREILQQIYIDELNRYGFAFKLVSGQGEDRLKNAIQIIDQHLTNS